MQQLEGLLCPTGVSSGEHGIGVTFSCYWQMKLFEREVYSVGL